MNSLDEEDQNSRYQERGQRRNVGSGGTPDYEHTSERRTNNHRSLHRRGRPGCRLRQLFAIHDVRHKCCRGRAFEGAACTQNGGGDQQMKRAQPALHTAEDKQQDHNTLHKLTEIDDSAAVVAVRSLAGRQRQQQHGQELCQADEAKLEGTVSQRVHLPADGDRQHLKSAGREYPRDPQA
ncbi:hypothetical protein D3C75_796780 [compost metagenome]